MTDVPFDTSSPSPALISLAQQHGVATEHWGWQGEHVTASTGTIRSALAALGIPAQDDAAIAESLAEAELAPWRQVLPPTVVVRQGWTPWIPVHLPHGSAVTVSIELEDGRRREAPQVDHWVEPREVDGILTGEATFTLPEDLPMGWHQLVAHLEDGRSGRCTLVVTPCRLELPAALREQRVWGASAQVYQVRSRRSWGFGDLQDLRDLSQWTGEQLGADFVLVNPMHAPEPVSPIEPSPYLPTTRRFADPAYLAVEEIPGFADLTGDAARRADAAITLGRSLNTLDTIDRDTVWPTKRIVLQDLFRAGLDPQRSAEFTDYCAAEGKGLTDFATWCALAEELGTNWRAWPVGLQQPHSTAVADYRSSHRDAVDFHRWLQWQLRIQRDQAQQSALDAGMSIGIVSDLAVGVHSCGADAWALADVLAAGVTVGAPPDQFNQLGQNWHQPPWHPRGLAEAGYAPYRDMLRTVLRGCGGIRIDHVIGLFRLWWVPLGQDADKGTYVHYDHEALIGILALEAQRAGAVVVGEDLGVVEPGAREALAERGVLGTSILWFEWADDGRPLAPQDYRELCLTAVTTHDLPPTAGYLELAHVALRDRLGLLTRPVEEERAVELAAIDKVRSQLVDGGLLAADEESVDAVVEALHRYVALTPSRMVQVAVADLAGDRRPINQPGTSDEYPNWRLPLADPTGTVVQLEDLITSQRPARIISAINGSGVGRTSSR